MKRIILFATVAAVLSGAADPRLPLMTSQRMVGAAGKRTFAPESARFQPDCAPEFGGRQKYGEGREAFFGYVDRLRHTPVAGAPAGASPAMRDRDVILSALPKGAGASLTIRYELPRCPPSISTIPKRLRSESS